MSLKISFSIEFFFCNPCLTTIQTQTLICPMLTFIPSIPINTYWVSLLQQIKNWIHPLINIKLLCADSSSNCTLKWYLQQKKSRQCKKKFATSHFDFNSRQLTNKLFFHTSNYYFFGYYQFRNHFYRFTFDTFPFI